MKAKLIIYWVATTLIGLETLAGGVVDLGHGRTNVFSGPFVVDVVTQLGYPVYVLTILGMWKLLGAIVLFLPGCPRLKEWAYAGIIFELTGASASWLFIGDKTGQFLAPLILAVLAITSWALRPQSRTLRVLWPAKATS
jgi:DoxX-like protein